MISEDYFHKFNFLDTCSVHHATVGLKVRLVTALVVVASGSGALGTTTPSNKRQNVAANQLLSTVLYILNFYGEQLAICDAVNPVITGEMVELLGAYLDCSVAISKQLYGLAEKGLTSLRTIDHMRYLVESLQIDITSWSLSRLSCP